MDNLTIITNLMKTILLKDCNGNYRPIKGTTKQDCYNVLGKIQDLLKTNCFTISDLSEVNLNDML